MAKGPSTQGTEVAATQRNPTRNLQAYDHFLRAEAQQSGVIKTDKLRLVLAEYSRAIEFDPDFSEAHAGYARAVVEIWLRRLSAIMPGNEARIKACEAAGRALELDPGNARALIVLSRIQAREGARDNALASARRAVAARPDDVEAHANLALVLSNAGANFEARTELEAVRRLAHGLRPEMLLVFGQIAFADARFEDVIADFATAWPELPGSDLVLEHLTSALALQGRMRQAALMKAELLALRPAANLHFYQAHYAFRTTEQNRSFLDGLRV